jgi:serine phosphatase RsbU (regulator of sigma subunit)
MRRALGLNSLSGQLTFWTALTVGVLVTALVFFAYRSARQDLIEQTRQTALAEVSLHALGIDSMVGRVASLVTTMAVAQGLRGPEPSPDVIQELRRILEAFPSEEVFGAYYTFENADYRDPMSMPWIDRNSYPEPTINRNDFHIDRPSTVWYWRPKKTGKLSITEPYFDAGGSNVTMLSVNAPVFGPEGTFYGIAGIDISLADMRQLIKEIDIFLPGEASGHSSEFAYLVSQKGTIIAHPDETQMIREGNPGVNISQLPPGAATAATPTGHATYTDKGGSERLVYWATAPLTGWKVVLDIPYSTLLAPVRSLAWRLGILGGAGLLLLFGVVALVARRVAEPLRQLTGTAAELEAGHRNAVNLSSLLRRRDEVGDLGRGFHRMAEEIQKREERLEAWNANLEKTVAERTAELKLSMEKTEAAFAALQENQQKLASELADAAAYVFSVLPEPLREGPVQSSWQFLPSSSLGGDAFDYGLDSNGRFSICLLDVCGHGVGAALLSISVLNVIRSESLPGVNFCDPADVLSGLNTAFPMEKHGEMFFTAWCGTYDPSSRRMRFSAGGHPAAIMVFPDGSTSLLAAKGPLIGAMPDVQFLSAELDIPPGARVFVFSDGAYEIHRRDGSLMKHEDLRTLLAQAPKENGPDWIIAQLREINSQKAFDDDVSLVELRFQ